MKSFVVLSALVAMAMATDPLAIDWSTVKPINELPSFQKRFPTVQRPLSIDNLMPKLDFGISGRVVGGAEATPNTFPYQAGLIMHLPDGNGFCGGSIVSGNFILTAAHCVDGVTSGIVILGAHNINLQSEPGQTRFSVNQFIIHPEWNSTSIRNDVAMIRLPQTVAFTNNIRPVRLPNMRQIDIDFVNQLATVSGWGRFSDAVNEISPVLRFVAMPVVSNNSCRIRFPTIIQESNICTSGENGRSPCSGDSGGPLTITDADGTTTQVGLVSFGLALGCERNWPAVFARLTSFLEWIGANSDVIIRPGW